MCSGKGRQGITPARFPHSDIPGSKPACDSPRLFAACHVLHRLLVPRHPPHALTSLAKKFAPDRHIRCRAKPDPCDKKGSINAQQKICWTIQFSKNRLASASWQIEPAVRGQRVSLMQAVTRRPLATHFRMIRVLPNGGEYRARTGDLLRAKQVLSQLS